MQFGIIFPTYPRFGGNNNRSNTSRTRSWASYAVSASKAWMCFTKSGRAHPASEVRGCPA